MDFGHLLADQIIQDAVGSIFSMFDFLERFQNSRRCVDFGRLLADQILQLAGNLGGHQIACHFGSCPRGPPRFRTQR